MIVITYHDSKRQLKQAGSFNNAADADRAVDALIANGATMSGNIYWNEDDVHKAAIWDEKGNKSYTPVEIK